MTAFKRFDTTAFFHNSEEGPAATAATAANLPPTPQLAANAASAAGGNQKKCETHVEHWRERFEERAAIIEHDGGVPRHEAEARVREHILIEWMNENPPTGINKDHCASCGDLIGRVGNDAVPFLTGGGGHVWLHHGCHAAWMKRRRIEAVRALAKYGA